MSAGSRFGTTNPPACPTEQTDKGTQATSSLQQDLLKETRYHQLGRRLFEEEIGGVKRAPSQRQN
jgi:hypothetical protein